MRCIQLEHELFKTQALWTGAHKNRIHQPGQMELSKISIKTFGVNFGNAILDNSNWDEISEGITKKSISGTQ